MRAIPGRLVLLGHPVAHSLSQRLQHAALAAAGIDLHYELLDVRPGDLDVLLATLRSQNAAGNVTVPHKSAVALSCDQLDAIAQRTGAVNAFVHEEGVRIGHNTDVAGFQELTRRVLGDTPTGSHVALLGAGGAAAAVCAAVEQWRGCRIRVNARGRERALRLEARFPALVRYVATPEEAVQDADVVINATPVGVHGEGTPFPVEKLPRDAAVMDLTYRPGETVWVRQARASGHRASDGLPMLIEQGAHAFELWFGIPADRAAMEKAVTT